jgi:hypothetical protein
MIRSGLVNTRRGGGFENGYPHQRDNTPRDEIVRPYVDGFDTGMGKPTDFSFVVPTPVKYTDIFSKRATPDERLYLLKMVQKGIEKIGNQLEKGLPTLMPPALPINGERPPTNTPINYTPSEGASGFPGITDDGVSDFPGITNVSSSMPDLQNESAISEELDAQDVVYPPPHESTFKEGESYVTDWITGIKKHVVHTTTEHIGDDVTPADQGFRKSKSEYSAITGDYETAPGSSINSFHSLAPSSVDSFHSTEEFKTLTKEEKAKIKFGARLMKMYESFTPEDRRTFVETLPDKSQKAVIHYLTFIEPAPGDMGFIADYSLLEYMERKLNNLPLTEKPRSYLGKVIELNGVGPRRRELTGVSKKIRPFNVRTDMPKGKEPISSASSSAPLSADSTSGSLMDVDNVERIEVSGGGYLTKKGKPKAIQRISAKARLAPEGSLRNLAFQALPKRRSPRNK